MNTTHPLIGSWKTDFATGGQKFHVEYDFGSDGTGYEKIRMNRERNPREIYPFSWEAVGERIDLSYASDHSCSIVMTYAMKRNRCILNPQGDRCGMILSKCKAH